MSDNKKDKTKDDKLMIKKYIEEKYADNKEDMNEEIFMEIYLAYKHDVPFDCIDLLIGFSHKQMRAIRLAFEEMIPKDYIVAQIADPDLTPGEMISRKNRYFEETVSDRITKEISMKLEANLNELHKISKENAELIETIDNWIIDGYGINSFMDEILKVINEQLSVNHRVANKGTGRLKTFLKKIFKRNRQVDSKEAIIIDLINQEGFSPEQIRILEKAYEMDISTEAFKLLSNPNYDVKKMESLLSIFLKLGNKSGSVTALNKDEEKDVDEENYDFNQDQEAGMEEFSIEEDFVLDEE